MTLRTAPARPADHPTPAVLTTAVGQPRRRTRRPVAPARFLYLLPMFVLVGVFLLYPALDTAWVSFTDWNGLTAPAFVGLRNYGALVTDPAFTTSFSNTMLWVFGVLVLQVVLGLAVAVALNGRRGGEFLKTVLYLPSTVSAAATGVIWFFLFDPTEGIVNVTLHFVHLGGLAQNWLATPPLNTYAMIVASTWQGLGPTMLLLLVGLQNIPRDPLQAAMIDGAGGWRLFWHMTLPLLRPMLTVVVGIALINSFKVFDLIWVMTQGGPYRSSETLAVTMYREAFVGFKLGYGASVAIVLSLIVLVLSIFYLRSMFGRDKEVY